MRILEKFSDQWMPEPMSGCYLWLGGLTGSGYAGARYDGKTRSVSRKVLLETRGIPPTRRHQASHTCDNKLCVNPDHLLWETSKQNIARRAYDGIRRSAKGYRKRVDKVYARPYEVRLQRNGKQVVIGYFATEEEAQTAYQAAIRGL